jgi:DNA-binding MarR family transcriptional regulator
VNADHWTQALATFEAILAVVDPATKGAVQQSDFSAVSGHWYHLVQAVYILPEAISVQRIAERSPYTNPKRIREALQILAAMGFLRPAGQNLYVATEKAQRNVEVVTQAQRWVFQQLGRQTLHAVQLERLRDLLKPIAEAVDAVTEPPHPVYDDVRRRAITPEQPVIEQIARYLNGLSAFRDDAHIQSWLPLQVEGIVWEALTLLWEGHARTAGDLEEQLPYRGHTQRDFSSALKKLVKLGWALEVVPGQFELTDAAREIRQQVEERTDAVFYAPWLRALDERERAELDALLAALAEKAVALVPG